MSDFVLPEALMMDIWLALPIKSTVRFRCVSKSWSASLSGPQFIYKNLTLFGAENDHDLLLVLEWSHKSYSVVSHEASPLQVSPLREYVDPYSVSDDLLTYSCDDLVCFHDVLGRLIGVWNLTTGETKILPPVNEFFILGVLGFGFDDKIQDYKIVKIGQCQGDDGKYDVDAVFVYSLRSGNNCWRKLDQPNVPDRFFAISPLCRSCCYSYRDGVFYWCHSKYLGLSFEESNHVILSFDMSSEVFNTISIPPEHPHRVIVRICKSKDGSMLLIGLNCDTNRIRYGEPNYKVEYELWVLLEVGVASSLTKLFDIAWQYGSEPAPLLGFWRNELVFACRPNCRLLIGDPSSQQEPKEVHIDAPLYITRCLAWTKGKNSDPFATV